MAENTSLRKNRLGFLEVIALSVAIVAPTFASSMNFGMIATNAGYSVSLVFVISTVALLLVALAFVKFGKEFSSAGSAYTYIEAGLGRKVGAVGGWALLLTYGCWTSGCSSAFGYLSSEFVFEITGIDIPWVLFTLVALFAIWYITYFDIQLSTRIMLFIELFAVLLLLVAIVAILVQVGSSTGLSFAPFQITADTPVTGIGAGMVAAMLSFGGFEGAASLGEESKNPRKYIPLAIMSTVIFAGVLYILVSFAEVNGFGVTAEGIAAFQSSGSSIVELSGMYMGAIFTIIITLAISISAFSTALGSMTACSRALYQLGKDGKVPARFANTHPKHSTPHIADNTIAIITVIPVVILYFASGASIDGFMVFQYLGTIGTIGLIIVYLLTCVSSIAYFGVKQKVWTWQNIAPAIGAIILAYVLWSNVAPSALTFPFSIFPYIAAAFLVAGYVVTMVTQKKLADRASGTDPEEVPEEV